MAKIVKQEAIGVHKTYDLEVGHPDHQFYLANGLLTSNSHAVSYALDSYMCAYLLTHYEPEWLCAYAETYSTDSDKKRERALSEIKALGYDLVKIDINQADKTWTILPGRKFMPSFLTCKSIGDAAIKEIVTHRPYHTIYGLLWDEAGKWLHSKFNKRAMENLIRVGAFESMDIVGKDKYFANYRHMHACIVENWGNLKKKTGRKLLDELASTGRNIEDWSREEKVAMYAELLGSLDLDLLIPIALREKLSGKGVTSIDDAVEGEKKIHWMVVTKCQPKKTKNGKDYMMMNVQGESGQTHRVFVWGWRPNGAAIRPNYAYLAEIDKNDFGHATNPWKMREIDA